MSRPAVASHVSRKRRRCSWCGEAIEPGDRYSRWRWYGDGPVTVVAHPECHAAIDECAAEDGEIEWITGENPRGCNCGHDAHCKRCNP